MAVAPPGDPEGPQRFVCLPCSTVRRNRVTGEPLRDAAGNLIYRCDQCVGRVLDRLCECWICPWLREGH